MTKNEKAAVIRVVDILMKELKRNTCNSGVKKSCTCSYCEAMRSGKQLLKALSYTRK